MSMKSSTMRAGRTVLMVQCALFAALIAAGAYLLIGLFRCSGSHGTCGQEGRKNRICPRTENGLSNL